MYQTDLNCQEILEKRFSNFYYYSSAHRPNNDKITKAAKPVCKEKDNPVVVQAAQNQFP